MVIPPEHWLQKINREFRGQNVSVRQRPFLALDRYCKDFKVKALTLESPPAKAIFDWFSANTKPEAHHIGPMFTGAFYYDACFWPVNIPIGFGTFKLEATDCLRSMPDILKKDLISVSQDAWSFALFFADCLDYAYGFNDICEMTNFSSFGISLLKNADKELRTAISQLFEHHPNSGAAMSSRMSVEMYLKVFLVLKAGLFEPCCFPN